MNSSANEKIHFVTGRLAESALREVVDRLSRELGFDYSIQVLPITVAALLTPEWIASRIDVPPGTTRVVLPGYADGDRTALEARVAVPIEWGPKDLRRLPEYFGRTMEPIDLSAYQIEIIAEINHAPRWSREELVATARQLRDDGADWIDVGCEPDGIWRGVGDCVRALRDEGLRVSIDSLAPEEIEPAVRAGAELVLSVNATNRHAAVDWGVEVVAIPDVIDDPMSLQPTMDWLDRHGVPFRIDPILEPIGLGFAASLNRYFEARRRWPDAEMMMGIGNLTELTDVDSAGVNFLLLAICEELGVRSVLTTEVINWARTSVRECDLARRLVHHAVTHRVPAKRLSDQLVCLRDARLVEFGVDQLELLNLSIRDANYRILAEGGELHLLGGGHHLTGVDPFDLFDRLMATGPRNVDPSHAFYLGYELCKALLANQLGKQYTQDESLDWGYLTVPETNRHRLSKRYRRHDSVERDGDRGDANPEMPPG